MSRKQNLSALKVALVSDDLTATCMSRICRVMHVTPINFPFVFKIWRPDLLFVESTWRGHRDAWRYKIASYPDVPKRNNRALARVVSSARNAYIPTVFWNREDGVHFDRFIQSARLFDTVFTVDEMMLPKYRELLAPGTQAGVIMFSAEPSIHYPSPVTVERRASFVGSYGTHIHNQRRIWQDGIFSATSEIGLTVHDRNSDRRPSHYRYPDHPWIRVEQAIPYTQTADVYRKHAVNLNVNTITDSPTAFSRRLVEILASGGFAVTNPTPAVERLFSEYCRSVEGEEDARELFARIARDGLSNDDRARAQAGAEYVGQHHTWSNRLAQILEAVN